jgi:hypothetical protein
MWTMVLALIEATRFSHASLVVWSLNCTCMNGTLSFGLLPSSRQALLASKTYSNKALVHSHYTERRLSPSTASFALWSSIDSSVDPGVTTDNNREGRLVWNRLFKSFQEDFVNYRRWWKIVNGSATKGGWWS